MADTMKELFKLGSTNHPRTTAYHPQTNGLCERFNRTPADMLSQYVSTNHRDWDKFMPYVLFAYNSSASETSGYSRFFLLYGYERTLSSDACLHLRPGEAKSPSNDEVVRRWEDTGRLVAEREVRAKEKNRLRYDQMTDAGTLCVRKPTYQRGKTSKLLHPYHRPYKLVRKTADNDPELENRWGKRDIVYIEHLKPYISREEANDMPTDTASLSPTNGTPTDQPAVTSALDLDTDDDKEFSDAVEFFPGEQTAPQNVVNIDQDRVLQSALSDAPDRLRRVPVQ